MIALLGFDLLRPGALAATLAAPLLLAIALWGLGARRRGVARLVHERHRARFLPDHSRARSRVRVVLASIGTLALAFALVGPVRGYTLREVTREGLDLVLCIDTSRSMLVQDLKPDRLTRAKREVTGLLSRLEGDRAAVLGFSGDVRLVAPLTHDRETLARFVETLDTRENLVGGTNLGAAIRRALKLFDGRTGAHEAIVLLTDGEDLQGHGLEAAQEAAERGIRVYVVGVGTETGGKIPDRGRFVVDEAGEEVVSRLDATTLRRISEETGGDFVSAESAPFPLEELYDKRISKLQSQELWAGKLRIPRDRYQWPLALAAACMLAEVGLRERRPRRRRP